MSLKKILLRVLMGLNGFVILGLLLLAGLLLYFSNAKTPTLLGNQAMLRDTGASQQLVLYQPGEPPPEGGQVLIRTADDTVALGQEAHVDADGVLACVLPSGESLSLALTAPEYLGRVTGVSDFWGGLFARIAAPNQLAITYVSIAIGFLLCVLLLAIIYLANSRHTLAAEEEEEEDEEEEEAEAEYEEEASVPAKSPAGAPWGPRKPLGTPRETPNWRERSSPFQRTPLSRPLAAPAAERMEMPNRPNAEEDVKIFRPHESEANFARTTNRYAAPHVLRTEAGRDAPAPIPPVRPVPPPSDEAPPPRPAPSPRREAEIVIRERAGDPYDLYDVGPSIRELLQELDKLE